ncbi:MAG TPA: ribonuclease HII [Gammaproteobacteria bacterium]|nr:ribonuclease HII [Gammaproteobacteria bacterium]
MNNLGEDGLAQTHILTAGVDEAGRGPLAGPVVAAAVILNPANPLAEIRDSKQLSAPQRERLSARIQTHALAWCVARADVAEIDRLNILHATLLAMQRAVAGLSIRPGRVLVDGNRCPDLDCPAEAIVKGDQKVAAIAAASILAKVARDREMVELDALYPGYGLARHKGYPTRAHIEALYEKGVTPHHRRSYAPVRDCLAARGPCAEPLE